MAPWLRATGEILDETCAPLVGQVRADESARRLALGLEPREDSRLITFARPTDRHRFEFGIVRMKSIRTIRWTRAACCVLALADD